MELIFIRHGRTNANDQKIYALPNEPLNERGKLQVNKLKNTFTKDYPVYISPYKRCQETASILFPKSELISEDDLREMSFGILEGRKFNEVYEKSPEILKPWMKDPYRYAPPEGESINEAYDRISKFISSIDDSSIFVTHDGVIRLALCYALGSPTHFFNFHIENASTVVIEESQGQKIIKSINGK